MVRSGVSSAIRYPELEDRKSRSKVIHLSGDLRLASSKARKRLGSEMSVDQRRRMLKHDREMASERRSEMRRQLVDALKRPPSAAQLLLPANIVGPVASKALAVFGDELLELLSLRQLPAQAKVTPKVLKIFGTEPGLIPAKARSLMGNENHLPAGVADRVGKRQRRLSLSTIVDSVSITVTSFR